MSTLTKRHTTIIIILSFIVAEVVFYNFFDKPLALYMKQLDTLRPGLINFFRTITDLGKSVWYLITCGVATIFCCFISRGKDVRPVYRRLFAYIGVRAFFLFSTIALSGIVADIIKPIVGRARPVLWLQKNIYGFSPLTNLGFEWNSMPSGHSTTAFALAFSLSVFYPRLRIIWFLYAFLLALSRIAVDAHYLSDVCAGAMLGWLTVYLFNQHGIKRIWKVIFPIDIIPTRP